MKKRIAKKILKQQEELNYSKQQKKKAQHKMDKVQANQGKAPKVKTKTKTEAEPAASTESPEDTANHTEE